jgi:cytochrome c553
MKPVSGKVLQAALALVASCVALFVAYLAADPSAAQPARAKPESGADLRAVFATPQDVAEGKRLAETACFRCHGASGISATPGVPHLAAQRAGYLHLQLKAYRQGPRAQGPMGGAVRFLSDDALVKVSAYFASLDPPRPAAAPKAGAGKADAPKPDPLQAGRNAAAACSGCHGDDGVSTTAGTPSLVGFDPKYFIAAMNAYKSGQRKHDMMKMAAAAVSDADLASMALFYALQKPARTQTPAPGDQAAGRTAAAACAGCHGEKGISSSPATPSLAGQDAEYLAAATFAYKDGTRTDEAMKGAAAALDDKTNRNIAAWYAAQSPQAPNVRKPLTTAEWTARCDRCHGVNGNSTDPMMPALAAQRADWLEQVLNAYRSGARKSSAMSAMSASMSEGEIRDVAAHYARQSARGVVFVVLPSK